MLNPRLDRLTDYPFRRLATLLEGIVPAGEPLSMSIGEPQHAPPALVARLLAEHADGWGRYPPMNGTENFRSAVAQWLTRRYGLPAAMVDADRHIQPLAGTREGLFQIALTACAPRQGQAPVVLLPNPFYQVYAGAAVMAGAEPCFVPATKDNGFLPDFSRVDPSVLERTALAYLCSPANPQGTIADTALLTRTIETARRYGFVLAADECYSEIYDREAPPGALQVCAALDAGGGEPMRNVVAFNSLSKRSSAPGLRSGFVVGDAAIVAALARLRSYGGASVPLPIMAASAALWRDEEHVADNRARYRAKLDIAEEILGGRFGFRRPAGGFFLWLEVGDGEAAARRLWARAGIRVLPGAYLARPGADGVNPGADYIRVALVHDEEVTRRALGRLAEILGESGMGGA